MTNQPAGRKPARAGNGPASPVMGMLNNLFFVIVVLGVVIAAIILAVTQL
jgi:hypothetical protein